MVEHEPVETVLHRAPRDEPGAKRDEREGYENASRDVLSRDPSPSSPPVRHRDERDGDPGRGHQVPRRLGKKLQRRVLEESKRRSVARSFGRFLFFRRASGALRIEVSDGGFRLVHPRGVRAPRAERAHLREQRLAQIRAGPERAFGRRLERVEGLRRGRIVVEGRVRSVVVRAYGRRRAIRLGLRRLSL